MSYEDILKQSPGIVYDLELNSYNECVYSCCKAKNNFTVQIKIAGTKNYSVDMIGNSGGQLRHFSDIRIAFLLACYYYNGNQFFANNTNYMYDYLTQINSNGNMLLQNVTYSNSIPLSTHWSKQYSLENFKVKLISNNTNELFVNQLTNNVKTTFVNPEIKPVIPLNLDIVDSRNINGNIKDIKRQYIVNEMLVFQGSNSQVIHVC